MKQRITMHEDNPVPVFQEIVGFVFDLVGKDS